LPAVRREREKEKIEIKAIYSRGRDKERREIMKVRKRERGKEIQRD
jgi:hypothetical protein